MRRKKYINIIKLFICIILGIFLGSNFDNVLLIVGIGMFVAVFLGKIDI
jgi:hypothetical protein